MKVKIQRSLLLRYHSPIKTVWTAFNDKRNNGAKKIICFVLKTEFCKNRVFGGSFALYEDS